MFVCNKIPKNQTNKIVISPLPSLVAQNGYLICIGETSFYSWE